MSITFSEGKLKGEERRAILRAIETQMQQVIIDGVTQVLQEFLEQEVTTKLGRPKRSPRRISSQARPIDWQCAYCGCTDANQFTRDGIIAVVWKPDGGTWTWCGCPCWNASAVSTTW